MLFDSTLRRELSRSFGTTLVVILTIVLTLFLIRTLGQAAGGRINPEEVILILGYAALSHLPTVIALSLFVSVVLTLGRMTKDGEMTIWKASGIGLTRFVRPVFQTSWPSLVLIALLAFVVWPWVNQQSEELKTRYQSRSDLARITPGQFQISSDGRRVFFIDRDTQLNSIGKNVFIFFQDHDTESVITASSGQIESVEGQQTLFLHQGQRYTENKQTREKSWAQFSHYQLILQNSLPTSQAPPAAKTLSTWDVLQNLSSVNQGELSWRLGLVLGAINLVLLGIGLSGGLSGAQRRRPNHLNLLFALLSFIIYYNLITLTQSWVASGKLSFSAALGLCHGSAAVLALALIGLRDHYVVIMTSLRLGK